MTRREIEDYLIELAMVNPLFREQLLAEPTRVLRDLGLPVGDNVHICVLEEEPQSFYLVLPRVLEDRENAQDSCASTYPANNTTDMFRFFHGYA